MAIVVFSGLDGSGKTTQVESFVQNRQSEGHAVRADHQFRFNSEGVKSLKSKLKPSLIHVQNWLCEPGTVGQAPRPRTEPHGPVTEALRRYVLTPPAALAFAGLAWWRSAKKTKTRREGEILVLDRYFYDELVRIEWRLGLKIPWRSLWLRLVPAPDLLVFLDLPAEVAYERNFPKDSTPEAMQRKAETYRRVLAAMHEHTRCEVIPVHSRSADEVRELVERAYAEVAGEKASTWSGTEGTQKAATLHG